MATNLMPSSCTRMNFFYRVIMEDETDKETESGNKKAFIVRHAEIWRNHDNCGDGLFSKTTQKYISPNIGLIFKKDQEPPINLQIYISISSCYGIFCSSWLESVTTVRISSRPIYSCTPKTKEDMCDSN